MPLLLWHPAAILTPACRADWDCSAFADTLKLSPYRAAAARPSSSSPPSPRARQSAGLLRQQRQATRGLCPVSGACCCLRRHALDHTTAHPGRPPHAWHRSLIRKSASVRRPRRGSAAISMRTGTCAPGAAGCRGSTAPRSSWRGRSPGGRPAPWCGRMAGRIGSAWIIEQNRT